MGWMPIPTFTIDGVLPPYVGQLGPGDDPQAMTPFEATAVELVNAFGTTNHRRSLLQNWLDHRAAFRGLGFTQGFQWIDGSFVEDKIPRDLDVVTFSRRPQRAAGAQALERLMRANPDQCIRGPVKRRYNLDAFFVDLDGSKESLVNATRYYAGLFSHRRTDDLWKGMVQVRFDDPADDAAAAAALAVLAAPAAAGAPGP
jgi:hypothetical protein